jgi:hypothetical protein
MRMEQLDEGPLRIAYYWCSNQAGHYPATFFFSARNFAHRFFVALPILALAAADRTRFLTTFSSLLVELPKALAAARTPFNWCCILPNCFSSFLCSRLIAAKIFINPTGNLS